MTMVNVRRKSAGEFRAVRLSLQRLLKVRFGGRKAELRSAGRPRRDRFRPRPVSRMVIRLDSGARAGPM